MDPITHASTGLLAAQALRRRLPEHRGFLPFCILAAEFPDLDNFVSRGDPEKYLLFHRSVSHSLLAAPLLAAVLAGTWKLLFRGTDFRKAWLTALALVVGHIWLDLCTSYGTQILAPLSHARFTLEAVYIVDPVFTGSLLLASLLAWLLPKRRVPLACLALAWVLIYPLGTWGLRQVLEPTVEARWRTANPQIRSLRLSPDAFTPWYWKVVADDGRTLTLGLVKTLDLEAPYPRRVFGRADRAFLDELGRSAGIFRTYEWFSLYPAVQRSEGTGREELTFLDLRFLSVHPLMRALFGERESLFTLTAVLDPASGRLVAYRYGPRGPLEPVAAR